jgi:exodeoxyribonuclease VII large subunit
MSRKVQSGWDFGELFPPEATRKVLTVSELTTQVKRLLENQVGAVWVTGEVTNFRAQSSGHMYFAIKDASSQVSCVLFRGEPLPNRNVLQDGVKVVLHGDLTVYEARGQYQLRVKSVELQGVGALQAAFERLKLKLQGEGLFAPERKRSIPRHPRTVGIVTSPTGAAIRDVLHVIQRRQPGLELILAPCRVQGQGAAAEIAAAIALLNDWHIGGASGSGYAHGVDLILVTRGGGSLEDLWAFNEEIVARAVAASAIPVISAVGHEIDFTICDFVADLRAATPSAAAELMTEGAFTSRRFCAEAAGRLSQLARRRLDRSREDMEEMAHRLVLSHPRRRLDEGTQRLDDAQAGLLRNARQGLRLHHARWLASGQALLRLRPAALIQQRRDRMRERHARLADLARHGVEKSRNRFDTVVARFELLSPKNVLRRGYSITTDETSGAVIQSAAQVRPGQALRTRLKDGEIRSILKG